MTIKDLEYIIAIYDEMSCSAAAEKLHVSQPSMSLAVDRVEDEFSCPLFTKSGRRMTPTPFCVSFVESGKKVLDDWKLFNFKMKARAAQKKNSVTVSTASGLHKMLFPYILRDFGKKHPEIQVNILEENSDAAEMLAQTGVSNFCLIQVPSGNLKMKYIVTIKPEVLFCIPSSHPFCKKHPYKGLDNLERVSLKDFANDKFVLINHPKWDPMYSRIFGAAGFYPTEPISSLVFVNVVSFIRKEGYVGFVDEIFAGQEYYDDVAYYLIEGGPYYRDVVVGYNPDKELSENEKLLIESIKGSFTPFAGN